MTIPLQSASLYDRQEVFVLSDYLLDLGTDSLVGNMFFFLFLYEMRSTLRKHLISMAFIFLWSSVVRVHDSNAYRKMDVTRERISRILDLREILLSLQTGFSLVTAADCAVLESI